MRRVNLIPPEERRGAVEALPGGTVGLLLVVGALFIILFVGIYVIFLLRLNGVEQDVAELEEDISRENGRLAELAPYQDLRARLDEKKPIADGIFRTRFQWDEFLQGLAFVIPETTALETLTGEAAPVDVDAPVEEPLDPPGAVTFTGVALPRYENVADFVVRMNNLEYLANSQLDTAELDRETFVEPAISFEVASELVTVTGEGGTGVRIEGGSPAEVADSGEDRNAVEIADAEAVSAEQYADETSANASANASASASANASVGP